MKKLFAPFAAAFAAPMALIAALKTLFAEMSFAMELKAAEIKAAA